MIPAGIGSRDDAVELFGRMGRSRLYWLSMVVIALAAEGIALYYQYGLNQYPCVLCIQVRLWVAAIAVVGVLGLILTNNRAGLLTASVLSVVAAIGFAERSFQTLATETGWIVKLACPMDAGLPWWFDLDQWFPTIFGVQTSCGPTPEMLFGVTMAQMLMAMSAVSVVITGLVLAGVVLRR